jgi:hypothetical protein
MKRIVFLLTFALALSAPAFAARGTGEGGKRGLGPIIKAADKNANRQIDPDELGAFNEAFAKLSTDSRLKRLDRDGDGKISDDEVKRLNERMARRAEGGKRKKNK